MKVTREYLTQLVRNHINEIGMGMGMPSPVPDGPAVAIAAGPEATAEEEVDSLLSDLQGLLDTWTERNPDTPAGQYYHELSAVFDKYGGGGCGGPPMEESTKPNRRNKK